jgi:U-box domain
MPMNDPVIASDGQTYERSAITEWLSSHNTSPMTRAPMSVTSLQPNSTLKRLIQNFQKKQQFQEERQTRQEYVALPILPAIPEAIPTITVPAYNEYYYMDSPNRSHNHNHNPSPNPNPNHSRNPSRGQDTSRPVSRFLIFLCMIILIAVVVVVIIKLVNLSN